MIADCALSSYDGARAAHHRSPRERADCGHRSVVARQPCDAAPTLFSEDLATALERLCSARRVATHTASLTSRSSSEIATWSCGVTRDRPSHGDAANGRDSYARPIQSGGRAGPNESSRIRAKVERPSARTSVKSSSHMSANAMWNPGGFRTHDFRQSLARGSRRDRRITRLPCEARRVGVACGRNVNPAIPIEPPVNLPASSRSACSSVFARGNLALTVRRIG